MTPEDLVQGKPQNDVEQYQWCSWSWDFVPDVHALICQVYCHKLSGT